MQQMNASYKSSLIMSLCVGTSDFFCMVVKMHLLLSEGIEYNGARAAAGMLLRGQRLSVATWMQHRYMSREVLEIRLEAREGRFVRLRWLRKVVGWCWREGGLTKLSLR